MSHIQPTVPIPISRIIHTTARGVFVELASGGVAWIPRDWAGFSPGHVIVPDWLAKRIKFKSQGKGGHRGKDVR